MIHVHAEAARNTRNVVEQINMKFGKEQSDAIMHVDGPMLVVAGPGSGKTTVIARRIKYLIESAGVSPADILVITFTKAAAGEMENRFKSMTEGSGYYVRFGTFHSIFFWIVKTAYHLSNSSVISESEKRNVVEGIMKKMSLQYENKDDIVSSIISQVSLVKCDMLDIDSYYSKDMPETVFRELYRRLNEELKRNGKIDFDDMMVMCYELLTSRADILTHCQNIFKYIMVDEFQDSNRIQYEIFRLLVGSRKNAFVVGDDDQSVYGFRGARPEIMQQFTRDYPNAKIVKLTSNYRCDQKITEASVLVIEENKKRFSKKLKSTDSGNGIVKIIHTRDEKDEYNLIMDNIDRHVKAGIPLEQQAVIYRTNMQPRVLAMRLNRLGIPYVMNDSLPNIFEHFAPKGILDYMKVAMGDRSRTTFLRIINKPGRYINREALATETVDFNDIRWNLRSKPYAVEKLDKLEADIKLLKKMKPYAACNFIRKGIGFDDYVKWYSEQKQLDQDEFEEIMDAFANMIVDIESYGELFSFIREYGDMINRQHYKKQADKGIRLLTMHGSKGLEFESVYIMDVVEGVIPYKKSKTKSELEEERRMLYVAMTRAKHELYMYVPRMRGSRQQSASRFTKKLGAYEM
ncbi:MAG: ATP-dependent helicase [Clostridium sp.]|nr:ATP-dependent helicase [Clostridium sp.]MCM1398166.1 ATP-dependent helicase [Clostridium sp.]MCM1461003.1 ATP-dependent helicase [Bacteroides sp.]